MRDAWIATVAIAVTGIASSANAGELDGWCFPADSDECVGEQRPLAGNRFITCESNCTMSKPVWVRDMDAVLYDVTCAGDWGSEKFRMFVNRYTLAGEEKAVAVDEHGPTILERCR